MRSVIRYGFISIVTLLILAVLTAGVQGSSYVSSPSLSSDGRYVTFDSEATNLVSGDSNGERDIFVRDRQMGTTWLVSKNSAGVEGDDASYNPTISANGRYVTFYSTATNLVTGDTNGGTDVFVRDRQMGTTWLVSKNTAGAEGNGNSFPSSLSADGRYVVFSSQATNLVAGDTNGNDDIFVRDRQMGTTWLVSKSSGGVLGDGAPYHPTISADGRYVAFYSYATNLVSGDTNGIADIFVRDRQTGTTWLVSKNSAGVEGDGASYDPTISSDGRYVTFASTATNLVSGDTNVQRDIFVRDRQMGTTWLVSKSSAGVAGNGGSSYPFLSPDGRYITFESDATNLVSGDTNGARDIFVRDRQTGTTRLVSKSTAGGAADASSYDSAISADGRYVAFYSGATNLVSGDTNGLEDIFVRDQQTGTTYLVSKS